MPAIAAVLIRSIIQMAVTLGIVNFAERFIIPNFNAGIAAIMEFFGVNEDTAQDIMANEVLGFAESVGVGALVLRTKLPTKLAEKLGFSSKGYAKRKLSPVVEAKLAKTTISKTATAATTAADVEVIATQVAKGGGWKIKSIGDLLKYVTLIVGTPVGFFYALAQYVDYGAWQNPYQSFFQGMLSHIGIHPDTKLASAKTISPEVWKRIYSTIDQLKPFGISFPYTDHDTPYSRENLASVVDEIVAYMVKSGTQPTYKNVIAAVLLCLQFNGQEVKVPNFGSTTTNSYTSSSPSTSKATTISTTKVFTGIVSQGVVGKGLEFEARPDDLIESIEELRVAAANNLASYLQTLPGKIVYEVKVVASVTSKDGFKQTGTTQKIQTGTDSKGNPKYKTVTNKFATVILYALTDKGTKAKLTTIVLGPVNSAKLIVGQNDLRALETSLPSQVTTTDINDILGIETSNPVTVSTPTQVQGGAKSTVGQNAKTLYEWYTAHNDAFPSVGIRATIYQELGLGQSTFYTGTAEQNNKLLTALKAQALMPWTEADRYELNYNPATNVWSVDDHQTGMTKAYASRALAEQAMSQSFPVASDPQKGTGVETPQVLPLHGQPYSLAATTVGGMMGTYVPEVKLIQEEMRYLGIDTPVDGMFTDAFLQKYYKIVNEQVAQAVRDLGEVGWMRLRDQRRPR